MKNYLVMCFICFWALQSFAQTEKRPERVSLFHADITLTRPWQKGSLKVSSIYSRIAVHGTEQDFVSIDVYDLSRQNEQYSALKKDRWENRKIPIQYIEAKNEVTISESHSEVTGLLITVNVPEKFALRIDSNYESVFVFDLVGEIEINGKNAEVTVRKLKGAVVVNTEKGNINVDYKEVSSKYPNALSTIEGDIKLLVPDHSSTNIIISPGEGKVSSDFKMRSENRTDIKGTFIEKIKLIQLGMREATIGIRTLRGDVSIYNTIRK